MNTITENLIANNTYKETEVNGIPYTCRSIVGEDITIGSMLGFNGTDILIYRQGMIQVGKALNTAKKGEFIQHTLYGAEYL